MISFLTVSVGAVYICHQAHAPSHNGVMTEAGKVLAILFSFCRIFSASGSPISTDKASIFFYLDIMSATV